MERKNGEKTKCALLYAGGVGLAVSVVVLVAFPKLVLPAGVLMVLFVVLMIKGFCDFVSTKLENIVGNRLEKLSSDTSLDEIARIHKATFMRVKKLNSDVEEVLDRSGMSREEMAECNRILSDDIAKRQMCIANIQIKRNVENTDALLNSNDKILGQFSQITRMVQKHELEAEISRKDQDTEKESENEAGTESETVKMIPEDSIEIIDDFPESLQETDNNEDDPGRQMTPEEIAALIDSL